jgi:hypothetical protein
MIFSGFRSQLSGFRFQVSPPVTRDSTPHPLPHHFAVNDFALLSSPSPTSNPLPVTS